MGKPPWLCAPGKARWLPARFLTKKNGLPRVSHKDALFRARRGAEPAVTLKRHEGNTRRDRMPSTDLPPTGTVRGFLKSKA